MPACSCGRELFGGDTARAKVLVALDPPAKMPIPDDPGRRGVVGVVVRDGRMLVIRRSRSVVAPLVYCFPGGGIEAGESEEEALVREFREEVGVAVRPVRRLWQCVTAWKVDLAWWLVEMAARRDAGGQTPARSSRSTGSRPRRWPDCPTCWRATGNSCKVARKSPLLGRGLG